MTLRLVLAQCLVQSSTGTDMLPTLPTESARSGCKWSSTWMHCMFWYGYVVRREHAGLVRTSFNSLPACGNRMELAAVDVW